MTAGPMTAGPIRFDRDLRAFSGIGGIGAGPRGPRPTFVAFRLPGSGVRRRSLPTGAGAGRRREEDAGAPRRPRPGRTTDRGRSPGARSPSE